MASTRSKHFFAGMHAGKLIANFVANPRVRRAGLFQERDQFENDIAVERQAGFSVYRRANGRIVILAERLRCEKKFGDGFFPNWLLLGGQFDFNLSPIPLHSRFNDVEGY